MKKWIFAIGAGVGYVLGTRAGREKYDKMAAQARQVLDNPKVKETTDTVQTEATRLYDEGRQAVRTRLRQMRNRNGFELTEGRFGSTEPDPATQSSSPLAAPTTTVPTGQGSPTAPDDPSIR